MKKRHYLLVHHHLNIQVYEAIFMLGFFISLNTSAQQNSSSEPMQASLTKAEKVYGLSKFWQEVNYNFVYLDQVDRELWDSTYINLIDEVQETENDYEYYRLLQRYCASLKDGHTNVFFPREINARIYNTCFGEYRLFLTNVDGRAILTRVNASKRDELPIGSEIIRVNGMPTETYRQRFVVPYISSSTDHIIEDLSISRLLQGPIGTSFELALKLPDGSIKELTLTHTKTEEKEVFPVFEDRKLLDFKWLEEGMAYISLNSFQNRKIDTLFVDVLPELYKAKSLVIDLRNNGGGNTSIGYEILQYLTNDKYLKGSRSSSRLHIPSFKAWGGFLELQDTVGDEWNAKAYEIFLGQRMYDFEYEVQEIELQAKRIVVPTALLIGHDTASAAEDFLIAADKQQHMRRFGEPTFGSTGQPLVIALPGGGSARICTKKDTYPDGKLFVGVGIQPDETIKRSLKDFQENNDPVLERAKAYLHNKN